jgi:hypothetical protein
MNKPGGAQQKTEGNEPPHDFGVASGECAATVKRKESAVLGQLN